MSIPSSSDVEQTTTLSFPLRRASSTSSLVSLLRLPWWAAMLSTPRSLSLWTTVSVPLLVLVKMRVVRCSSMSSLSLSNIFQFVTS